MKNIENIEIEITQGDFSKSIFVKNIHDRLYSNLLRSFSNLEKTSSGEDECCIILFLGNTSDEFYIAFNDTALLEKRINKIIWSAHYEN